MPNKGYEEIKNELKVSLKEYFKNRIGTFSIYNQTDTPYTMFNMEFEMYNYFNVILNYDRGSFGCVIVNGNAGFEIENSQKWYDTADMDIFLKELKEQLELRIPDKFLEYNGWK